MLTSLLALLITLRSILRSRLDLQLEILALRHQIGVLQRSAKERPRLTSTDRLLWVSLSRIWPHLALDVGARQTRNGCGLASQGLPPILDLEGTARTTRTAGYHARDSGPDPQDVPGESHLGCTAHSWRTAQARHQHRREQCHQVHGPRL